MIAKRIMPEILKKSFLPFVIIVLACFLYIMYLIKFKFLVSHEAIKDIDKAILTIFILCITFWLQRLSGAFFSWYVANKAIKTDLITGLIPLLRRVVKTAIWIIALVIILSNFGININALVATLGVSSLAIALAAQDTIANIIAGFLIMIDRPFRIKDTIKLPSGEKVEVLDIGIRRSKFLAEDGAIIIVPNLDLSKSKIINYSYGEENKK